MYCNESIHSYLYEELYIDCPFCYNQIKNSNSIKSIWCDNTNITNDASCLICKNCASVHGYQPVKEYIDFYENRYRIKRKSVYKNIIFKTESELYVLKIMYKYPITNNKKYCRYLEKSILLKTESLDNAILAF